MKTKTSRLFILIVLMLALALQGCTIQLCQQWFGYNPHPGHLPPARSCQTIYTDGQRPTITIMRPGIFAGK